MLWPLGGTLLKILFADDEEVVRIVGAEVLSSLGYEVLSAKDGRQALDLFAEYETQWRVIVLDWVMPYLSGDRVLEHIQTCRPELPVILISGSSLDEIQARCRVAIAGFLHKPFSCDDLADMVESVLAAAGPRG